MSQSLAFDRAAGYYDETRGFPPEIAPQIAPLFCRAGNLTASSRVLEVGVGTGRISLPLASHVHSVCGVDLARPMLDRLCAKRQDEPVFPVMGDATRLPYASRVFDAAIAVHVFHLIPGWRTALDDVARVLVPDGVLLTGWNSNPHRDPTMQRLWEAWSAEVQEVQTENVGVRRDAYDTFLPDSGWRQVGEDRSITFPIVRLPRNFVNLLERRIWSSCWRLPDDAVTRGVAAVRAAIEQHGIDPDAPIHAEEVFTVRAYLPPV